MLEKNAAMQELLKLSDELRVLQEQRLKRKKIRQKQLAKGWDWKRWGSIVREYTIYEIEGYKVGCCQSLERRTNDYKRLGELRPLKVLEVVKGNAHHAADREHYWADRLGHHRGCRYDQGTRS